MTDTLFDREARVAYGQIYILETGTSNPEFEAAFRGQANGLLGVAVPGAIWLTTGLHTGRVALTIARHQVPPPVDPAVEEVVEASFAAPAAGVRLEEWAGGGSWPLTLVPGDYRVRLSAAGLDAARAADTLLDGEPVIDRYRLDLWPSPPAPDAVLRATSDIAAYWPHIPQVSR